MSVNTATKIPAITQIRGLPPLAVMALQAIKETLEVREGLHEPLDRFVSVRELADLILNDESIVDYLGSGHSHDDRYFTKSQWDLDAKGDLNVAQGAGVPGTLAVGSPNQLIRADTGAALGIEYFSLLGTSDQVIVTHNAVDATLSLPQSIHSGASPTFSALTLSNIVAGVADYDKFIVSHAGVLKFRTGAEVLSDIGAAGSGHTHALNDLSDVDCSGPTDGDVLTYQSGTFKWEDIAPSGGGGATDYAFRTITGITNDVVADLAHDTLTLAVGNNKLTILGTAATDTITFTVNEGNIDHNGLLNTHNLTTDINHATITGAHNLTSDIDHNQISNLTVGDVHTQYLNLTRHDTTTRHSLGTVVPHDALSALTDTSVGTPSNDDVLTYKSASGKWESHAGGGGAVQYTFRTITGITNDVVADLAEDTLTLSSANNLLSIVGTAATDTITFTVNQGNIDHGSIGGLGDSADHTWALLVDGTRPLTANWNIGNFNLGINTAPSYPFHLSYSPGDEAGRGLYLNINPTGTHTAARQYYGIYLDIDTSADQSTYNSTLKGIEVNVNDTGKLSEVYAFYGLAQHNNVNTTNTMRGMNNQAYIYNGAVTNAYACFNNLYYSGGGGSSGYGIYSAVQFSAAGKTLGVAYGNYNIVSQTAGTLTTGYLYYGNISGTIGTKWGIYLSGEDKNYFSGKVGVGVDPSYPFHLSHNPGITHAERSAVFDISPSGTLTGTATQYGVYYNSNITIDQSTYQYTYNGVRDYIYLGSTSKVANIYSRYGLVYSYSSNSINNLIGARVSMQSAGSGNISSLYGYWPSAELLGSATITNMIGARIELKCNSGASGTVQTAKGIYLTINRSGATWNTAYLFHGTYTGTIGTKWGIYFDGEDKNYFSGQVGIKESTPAADLDIAGTLILLNGTSINEFSTDGTLAGDSDNAVPTEKAIKTYIDGLFGAGGAIKHAVIKTGTYTGDGTTGQAITGVGFQPKFVFIWLHPTADAQDIVWTSKLDRTWGDYSAAWQSTTYIRDNRINSLDSDGFTVDDDGADIHPNKSGQVYDYMAFGEETSIVVGDVASANSTVAMVETGTYTGDGSTSKVISLADSDLTPKFVRIVLDPASESTDGAIYEKSDEYGIYAHYHSNSSGHGHLDNRINSFAKGSFTVDDDGADYHPNANGVTYNYVVFGTKTITAVAATNVPSYVKVSDVKNSGTAGGTFTQNAWQTRVLNTEDSDPDAVCSLSSNQITLTAGTYECKITAPGFQCGQHQAILYNVTDASTVLIGSSAYQGATAGYGQANTYIVGRFTIAASKSLEVRHQCGTTKASNGLGVNASMGISEVYTVAEFWKVG